MDPRALFKTDADEDEYLAAEEDLPKDHVLRNLSDSDKQPIPGRVYYVCKGIDFHLSDNIKSITDAAIIWFNESDTDESIVDSDAVYVKCADNIAAAIEGARADGALNMVTVVEPMRPPSIPSPVVEMTSKVVRNSPFTARSKFDCSPTDIAPAVRLNKSSNSVVVKSEHGEQKPPFNAGSSFTKIPAAKVALVTPNPYSKTVASVSESAKLKKKLDLRNASVDISMVQELVDQQSKLKQEMSDGGPDHYLYFSGTNAYEKDGRVGATGVLDFVNASFKQYWTYKPSSIPVAFTAACFSVNELAHLRQIAGTLHTVVNRRHPHGKNAPKKTPANAQGRSYNIETIAFYADLTPFVQGVSDSDLEKAASDKLVELLGDMHQVFTSPLFQQALDKSMESNPRTERFFKNTVCKDNNLGELHSTIKKCKLKIDVPAPLSQHLLDDDIVAAMQMITSKHNPSDWTEEEKQLAYKDGNIPEEFEADDEAIHFE